MATASMLKLRDKSIGPPGGWRFRQPESGMLIRGGSWSGLLSRVKQHRKANGYPITIEILRQVEAFMYKAQPDACVEVDDVPPRTFRLSEVVSFTGMMLESIFTGSERADEVEANRRASICAGCEDNIEVEGNCVGCASGAIQRMVMRVCGDRATQHGDLLHTCRHCGCLNKAQVWFPLRLLQGHTGAAVNDALPRHCWKKKT